jgi:microsomal dipeptidase-like Zn-dependent dipeptidase
MDEYVEAHPELFPPSEGYGAKVKLATPEQLTDIVRGLFAKGYSLSDVRKIIGGNFARIARATWRGQAPSNS